jgi:hypothetical protein
MDDTATRGPGLVECSLEGGRVVGLAIAEGATVADIPVGTGGESG